jgi:hypothetical protein
MTTLERIGIEIAGGIVMILAAALWWHLHNLSEQKQGAQSCIEHTTITKQDAASAAGAIETDEASILKERADRDAKIIDDLQRGNADLVERLRHADSLRPSAVRNTPGAARSDSCAVEVPRGQSEVGRADAIAAAEVAVLNDCDALLVQSRSAIDAYNSWRDKMLTSEAEKQKKAPH